MATFLVTVQRPVGQAPERFLRNGECICDVVAQASKAWPDPARAPGIHVRMATHQELSHDFVLSGPAADGSEWLRLLDVEAVV